MNKLLPIIFNKVFTNNLSSILRVPIRNKYLYNAAVLKAPAEKLGFTQNEINVPLENGELLVKVEYCTLNFTDVSMFEREEYLPQLPFIPGYEFSGEVVETTPLGRHKVGERVVCLSRRRTYGGMANYCIVCADDAWVVPYTIPLIGAAVLPYAAPSALMVFAKYASDLPPESTVLISVGPDGLGLQCVEMACSVFRLKVVAVCSTENRGHVVREAGAFKVITTYVPAFPRDMLFTLPEDNKIRRRPASKKIKKEGKLKSKIKLSRPIKYFKKAAADKEMVTMGERRLSVIMDITEAVGGKYGASLLVDSVGKEMLCLLSEFVKVKGKIITLYPYYDPKTIDAVNAKIQAADAERQRAKKEYLEQLFYRKVLAKLKEIKEMFLPMTKKSKKVKDEKDNRLLSERVIYFDIHKYRVLNTTNFRILIEDVFSLYENGLITGHVSGRFLLHEINEAIDFILNNKSTGKVVIELQEPPSELVGDFTLEEQYNEQRKRERHQEDEFDAYVDDGGKVITPKTKKADDKQLQDAMKVEADRIKEEEKQQIKKMREEEERKKKEEQEEDNDPKKPKK